ncbi:plasmid recombination protein [Thalassotalea sp. 1_MG-2023]|uniref:plasmid recombination protein n=1 Tax=Thalassotalea sp. 1_MG-2023 TaxID=3062680 RepID=UPI0026E20A97|nr:plasmid recombination protein [Thalassotalea sp. 1_MG-2023]MDO6426112.1 plasmid recombination protein [Thalassotalea sp. 1_MG-2023]
MQKNSYQFLHMESYALKKRKNSKRPTAEAVARECQRTEHSYPHIQKPEKPELLYGIKPLEALDRLHGLIKNCKDPLGRKIRSDAQIVSFGIASIKVESTPENWELPEVKKWLEDTENFLRQRFGDSFVSLVKHSDERFCHVHFCIMPRLNDDGKLDLNSFHPGLAAQRAIKSNSKSKKDFAYKEAMRELQDQYFEDVGLKNGQLRHGPRRRRLTRHEWYAQKRYANLISNIVNEQSELIYKLSAKLEKAKHMLTNLITSKIPSLKKPSSHSEEFSS